MDFKSRIQKGKSLSSLSTLGIGGKARLFIEIYTIDEMIEIHAFCKKQALNFWIVGKGSNSLFDDRGFNGLIILNKINFFDFDEGKLHVGAGYNFSLLGTKMAQKGWGGLEFAAGIPGSIGGAIYMNAGANGTETAHTLKQVGYIDGKGAFIEKNIEELKFSYRFSSFQEIPSIIVSGKFELKPLDAARKNQLSLLNYRISTQPYGEKSAGCIFRNQDTISAGALIEKYGLKGKEVGGAKISMKHGNFIVNTGKATAKDVQRLIAIIQNTIKEKTGKQLHIEVCSVPYEV